MNTKNLTDALAEVRDLIIKESKENLIAVKKGGGALEKSIKGTPVTSESDTLTFQILMEDYATFVDKGVSGTKQKYDTPYSYKDKMPPPSSLDKWIVRKGIAPRDEQGRFMTRKTLQFLIARSIFTKGIKPSLFYTEPYHKYLKNISKRLQKSYRIDVKDFTEFIIKKNNGKN
ncbi:MAG: hypothetical protein QNK89_04555 [Lacinutrix sp.]|uniref:hypothetical protein n=1 Tax=Lacinutrix sp. TaxID=1937692 RepID=UPI0030B408E4